MTRYPYVGIVLTSIRAQQGETIGVSFMIETRFREDVILVRDEDTVVLGAATWWQPPLLGVTSTADATTEMQLSIRGEVDNFMTHFLAVNPKK